MPVHYSISTLDPETTGRLANPYDDEAGNYPENQHEGEQDDANDPIKRSLNVSAQKTQS